MSDDMQLLAIPQRLRRDSALCECGSATPASEDAHLYPECPWCGMAFDDKEGGDGAR